MRLTALEPPPPTPTTCSGWWLFWLVGFGCLGGALGCDGGGARSKAAAQPKPGFRPLCLAGARARATAGACTPRRQRMDAAHPVSGLGWRGGGTAARPSSRLSRSNEGKCDRGRQPLLVRARHRPTQTPQSIRDHASHLDRGAVKVAAGQRRHGLDGRGAGARASDGGDRCGGRAARGGGRGGARGVRAESHGCLMGLARGFGLVWRGGCTRARVLKRAKRGEGASAA